jgi:DNA primase
MDPPAPAVIRSYFEARVKRLTWSPGGQGSALCPFHEDHNKSLSVNGGNGLWRCFAGCDAGDIYAFEMRFSGCDFKTARAKVMSENGQPRAHDREAGRG